MDDVNINTAKRIYGNDLKKLTTVTNMNSGFKGFHFLNRSKAVDIRKFDRWINDLVNKKKGCIRLRPFASFTLPGSHDAMTYAYSGNFFTRHTAIKGGTKTQSLRLVEQFKIGIRYFDIRVKANSKGFLYGVHGKIKFTHVDAAREIRDLLLLARLNEEPIVIKFKHNVKAYPILRNIASGYASNLISHNEYWEEPLYNLVKRDKFFAFFINAKKPKNLH
ncbi:hypothetical protein L0B53_04445 [Vibrio sp. SS-MA-C1-2]|uniref:hypothetical protein n=1 Tax=Vibrio sp. SS-MA-C1-2 TaxID=2908646 RepID=UPI001F1BADD8|nr:hypothetical protein [Vibrio sp. SS-MA-C1-2]UJF17170.1 hypothetical protein L0B53_04445 [Vibrio sp. SS-MA-C1-2]